MDPEKVKAVVEWPSPDSPKALQRFRDIHSFVLACLVCSTGKTSNWPPDGLLQPLPVPLRPWSHIAQDFTALPPSQGNTVILTVVDRFSKAAHFIPLPKFPSAKETASWWTWSPTEDSSLCPNFGKSFVSYWEQLLVCLQGFIPRAMAKLRRPTRIWRGYCDIWFPRILPHGANNCPCWSTPTTCYQCRPWVYLRLSVV